MKPPPKHPRPRASAVCYGGRGGCCRDPGHTQQRYWCRDHRLPVCDRPHHSCSQRLRCWAARFVAAWYSHLSQVRHSPRSGAHAKVHRASASSAGRRLRFASKQTPDLPFDSAGPLDSAAPRPRSVLPLQFALAVTTPIRVALASGAERGSALAIAQASLRPAAAGRAAAPTFRPTDPESRRRRSVPVSLSAQPPRSSDYRHAPAAAKLVPELMVPMSVPRSRRCRSRTSQSRRSCRRQARHRRLRAKHALHEGTSSHQNSGRAW